MKDMNINIQEAQQMPHKDKLNRDPHQDIWTAKDKDRSLRAAKDK